VLIRVRVTTNSREPSVKKVDESTYEVRVDEKATEGKANKRLVEILAEHFQVPKSRISIVRGTRSREKTVEVGA
jgi:uncharacterized protein